MNVSDTLLFPGVQFPRGIILYGPSGVGKSLLARAVASEATPTHSVQLSAAQLLTQDSENVFQKVFLEARERYINIPLKWMGNIEQLISRSPSLIILDDLEALCPRGDSGLGELERRAVGSLLTQLDDLHRHPPPCHVTILATTNQIDRVPSHLRRPGRFDKEVEVPVPSAADRIQVFCGDGVDLLLFQS